jgi:hypothetical protein
VGAGRQAVAHDGVDHRLVDAHVDGGGTAFDCLIGFALVGHCRILHVSDTPCKAGSVLTRVQTMPELCTKSLFVFWLCARFWGAASQNGAFFRA